MAFIKLDDVSVVFPILGAGQAKKLDNKAGPEGAGTVVADSRNRGRGVVALANITIEAETGHRIGLIGRNGSGKSTLLRTIAGIYEPQLGEMQIQGRVAGLFNMGLGTRMEASGYRNIELAGLLAGYSRKETRERMPEIAEFTELGDYLNMPVRTYSNGMAMRLKFASGTAFSPDILLMDEWLGAGDPAFREKANQRMQKLVEDAGILFLASHNHNVIKRNCDRAIWLDNGVMRAFGPVDDVLEAEKEHRLKAKEASPKLPATPPPAPANPSPVPETPTPAEPAPPAAVTTGEVSQK